MFIQKYMKAQVFKVCKIRLNQFVKTVTQLVCAQVHLFIHYTTLEKIKNRTDLKRRTYHFKTGLSVQDRTVCR